MMNDRFDANLRQHLLGTADDRPADGQLAAVVRAVGRTSQRHPLAARLTWNPGRIGRFPSTPIRYGLIGVALVLAAMAGSILAPGSRGPSTVFEGTWTSTDPVDGSVQLLVVGAGDTPDVYFEAGYASGAGCVNDPVKRFTARGSGAISGNHLDATFPIGGGCGLLTVGVPGSYHYDAATDTLIGQDGLRWYRALGGNGSSPTAPATSAADQLGETQPTSECFEIPSGEAYRNDVGPLSLTVTIPSTAASRWEGYRGAFEVSRSCLFSRAVVITASIVSDMQADCDVNSRVEVATQAEAVAALQAARGIAMSAPTSVTLGGYPAARFEIASDAQMCFDEVALWDDVSATHGSAMNIHLVDVDGVTLGVTILDRDGGASPAELAEAEAIVASMEITPWNGPLPSVLSTPPLPAGCLQFNGGGTYTAPAGPWSVSATIPGTPDTWWHGLKSSFFLSRSPCLIGAPLIIEAELVAGIPENACAWSSTTTDTTSAAEAATLMASQRGPSVSGPTELTIGGFTAFRLDLSLPGDYDTTTCDDGVFVVAMTNDGPFTNMDPGELTFYLIDVDGTILGVRVVGGADDDIPTLGAELDEIIGSLDIAVP